MATNIVPGLFGVTPESYRQQQQTAFDARAFQNVQLTPQQQANLNIQSGAYGLAGGIGRMFGGEDPQMKIISGRNAVLQQIDQSNPESIMNGAKLLAQSGDNEGAMSLANYARQAQSELAGVAQKSAAATASLAAASRTPREGVAPAVQVATRIRELTMERANVSPYGSEARAIDAEIEQLKRQEKAEVTTPEMKNATALALKSYAFGTPEFNAEYTKILERLTAKPGEKLPEFQIKASRITEIKDALRTIRALPADQQSAQAIGRLEDELGALETTAKENVKTIGVAQATGEPVYIDVNTDQQFVYKSGPDGTQRRVLYSGSVDRTTAKTSVSVDSQQEKEFAKKRGTTQAQTLADATVSAAGARQALTGLAQMKQLDASGQLFTGPLATPFVGATSLLSSIGLLSSEQTNRLTSSEVYDKSAKDLVMQDLGGKLGAQISDADRKFVESRIPQLTTSAKARTELIGKIEEIQRGKISYYTKMNAHANKFGTLNDFDFSEQYAAPAPAPSLSLQDQAKAELARRRQKQ
jgi:hypothetical protein